MISTTYRFIAYELGKGDTRSLNAVFNVSLIIHLSIAFVLIVFAETIGVFYIHHVLNVENTKITDALFVFHFSMIAVFFSIISIPFQGMLTAYERFSIIAIVQIFRSTLELLLSLLLLYYVESEHLRIYSVFVMILSVAVSLLFIVSAWYNYKDVVRWSFQKDLQKYKEMGKFSWWISVGAGASIGEVQGSALIINYFFGTILNASFGIASQVNRVVKMFSATIGQAVIPQITKGTGSGDSDRVKNLLVYSSKFSFFLLLFPSLPILMETNFYLNLWLVDVPPNSAIFVQLMITNALIATLLSGFSAAIHATGNIRSWQLFTSITSLLSLPIAFVLFELDFPPQTILIIYIISTICNIFFALFFMKKLIQLNIYEFIKSSFLRIFLVIITLLPLFFLQYFSMNKTLYNVSLIAFISIIWLSLAIFMIGLSKREQKLITSFVLQKVQK